MPWPPVDIIEMLNYIEDINYDGLENEINIETNQPYTEHEVAEIKVAQFWDNIYDEEDQKKLIVANSEFLRSRPISPMTLGHHLGIPKQDNSWFHLLKWHFSDYLVGEILRKKEDKGFNYSNPQHRMVIYTDPNEVIMKSAHEYLNSPLLNMVVDIDPKELETVVRACIGTVIMEGDQSDEGMISYSGLSWRILNEQIRKQDIQQILLSELDLKATMDDCIDGTFTKNVIARIQHERKNSNDDNAC